MRRLVFGGLVLLGAVLRAPAQDELGLGKMWTFERPPLAYLQREYGFVPDEAWWTRVQLASLRFGRGCSASFVSPQGLILTNHHCVRDAVAAVQGSHDWVRDGFVAAELPAEVRLPGLTVQQLVQTEDVTARLEEGVAPAADAETAERQRSANAERVLAEARSATPALEPQLVKLFQGAVWQLYRYRVFDDVRLVMLPHLQVSHFGGDPDNFVFPRYALDFAFCRAYRDGVPADTAATHLPWSDGPAAGELVFLTGNPGGTQRLLTQAQLGYQRDVRYPRVRELIDGRLQVLRRAAAAGPDAEKQHRTTILSLENGQKLFRGEHAALLDPAFQRRKEQAERAFVERARQAGHQDELAVWERLQTLMREKQALEAPLHFHTVGGLPLLLRATALVEFAVGGDPAAAQKAQDVVVVAADPVARELFIDHLQRAQRWLPADDPWLTAVLGGRPIEAAVEVLSTTSRLADAGFLQELLAGGPTAVAASQDPALVLARVLRPLAAANAARAKAIEAAETQLGTRLARLLFAVYGHEVSPDATFTLRFSDGRVAGYEYNGTRAPWRTVFHGLFARRAEFDGEPPFDLPDAWLRAADRLDMQAPVDFVCTVDSTGGNSGSPVVGRDGRLVGLLFDGNIESLANEFLYGERVERSVCVHPQGIVEALRKVYRAERVLRELAR